MTTPEQAKRVINAGHELIGHLERLRRQGEVDPELLSELVEIGALCGAILDEMESDQPYDRSVLADAGLIGGGVAESYDGSESDGNAPAVDGIPF